MADARGNKSEIAKNNRVAPIIYEVVYNYYNNFGYHQSIPLNLPKTRLLLLSNEFAAHTISRSQIQSGTILRRANSKINFKGSSPFDPDSTYYQWKSWALSGTPLERDLQECLIFITLALHGLKNSKRPPSKDGRKGVKTFENTVFSAVATEGKRKSDKIGGLELAHRWKKLTYNVKDGVEKVLAS
ncbi:hypothetical protein N0V83_010959 [Neocucurbitaria cava]|uniref:Uncharacterized protein n=1 Tax=Neocucurbitaria cava TaxID=798079 RepID=A0A9W8XXJ0_9PLEO|nr:hypothetical protein N0V83_010959 [Neocucurbitaria cava]